MIWISKRKLILFLLIMYYNINISYTNMSEKDIKQCWNEGIRACYLVLKQFMSKEKALLSMETCPFFLKKNLK